MSVGMTSLLNLLISKKNAGKGKPLTYFNEVVLGKEHIFYCQASSDLLAF